MESLLDFILALATLLSGAGWLTERRKRKADSEKAELDVSTIYVKEFNENIVTPLKEELAKIGRLSTALLHVPGTPTAQLSVKSMTIPQFLNPNQCSIPVFSYEKRKRKHRSTESR